MLLFWNICSIVLWRMQFYSAWSTLLSILNDTLALVVDMCLLMDWTAAVAQHQSSTVDKAGQAKRSRAAVLEDMNSWTLDPETSLPLGGRPGGGGVCPWNGFGTLAAQYDINTLDVSFSLHVSSCSLLLYIYPSLPFYPSLIAHLSLSVLSSIHLLPALFLY